MIFSSAEKAQISALILEVSEISEAEIRRLPLKSAQLEIVLNVYAYVESVMKGLTVEAANGKITLSAKQKLDDPAAPAHERILSASTDMEAVKIEFKRALLTETLDKYFYDK